MLLGIVAAAGCGDGLINKDINFEFIDIIKYRQGSLSLSDANIVIMFRLNSPNRAREHYLWVYLFGILLVVCTER